MVSAPSEQVETLAKLLRSLCLPPTLSLIRGRIVHPV